MVAYDVAIAGFGPAGMSAAIYCANYGLNFLAISEDIGGYVNYAHYVSNYLGFSKLSGKDLVKNYSTHMKSLGIGFFNSTLNSIKKTKNGFLLLTSKGSIEAKSVIFSVGAKPRKLKVKGEEKKGVFYCQLCDLNLVKGKTAVVVGGRDSAAQAAAILSKSAKKIYLICRKEKIRAKKYLLESISKSKNIEIIFNSNLVEVKGKGKVELVALDSGKEISCDFVFINIGLEPQSFIAEQLGVKLNRFGRVKINSKMETSVDGFFAAGDIAESQLNQIVVAAGQGAVAANSAYNYVISRNKNGNRI